MKHYVIRIIEAAGIIGGFIGRGGPVAGQFILAYDPDAHAGRGEVSGTSDSAKARQFKSPGDAVAYWRRTSTVAPIRIDGKPNRPATALTVSIEPYEPEDDSGEEGCPICGKSAAHTHGDTIHCTRCGQEVGEDRTMCEPCRAEVDAGGAGEEESP